MTARPLILELSDGSLLGIEAVTNIGRLIDDGGPIRPEPLQTSLST
jgi:hypothetical protein